MSLLPSRGHNRGRNCYTTPASSRLPYTKGGKKIGIGYLISALCGAHKRTELLHNPCVFRGSPKKGRKSEFATIALPLRGPTIGRNCYVTHAISVVANAKGEEKIRIGYLTPAFAKAEKWAELHVTVAFSGVRSTRDEIKIGPIGKKDTTLDVQPKKISPKNFAKMVCLRRKTPLKTPRGPF